MTTEAELIETPEGLVPKGEGWYVINAADAAWGHSDRFGRFCGFEGDERFRQFGINIHMLEPGQPSCFYHRENQQEDFLVLSGECTLIIEGRERRLKAWDFFHCPPGTTHVFVGADPGPCAILMVGGRVGDVEITYPMNDVAARHGAAASKKTKSPQEAYAGVAKPTPIRSPWPAPILQA